MRMNNHPYGAILTEEMLVGLIPEEGARVIYDVNGVFPSVLEITLTPKSRIETNGSNFRQLTATSKYGEESRCLGDWNIGRSHNANYVFGDRESAEDYMRFAKENVDLGRQRKRHLDECDRWDRIFDLYDEGGD